MAVSRRDHLVDTALEMFCRDGFHATGIDKILAQAGVAKMTLYNHFRSKDELILAVLRRRDERFRHWFVRAVERRATAPRERLLAIFDGLEEWFGRPDFTGCTFINAAAEYTAQHDPIHAFSAEHKRLVEGYVRELAQAAEAADPETLARNLMLLIEGAIALAHVTGTSDWARHARAAAEVLIADALD